MIFLMTGTRYCAYAPVVKTGPGTRGKTDLDHHKLEKAFATWLNGPNSQGHDRRKTSSPDENVTPSLVAE